MGEVLGVGSFLSAYKMHSQVWCIIITACYVMSKALGDWLQPNPLSISRWHSSICGQSKLLPGNLTYC